MGGGCTHFGPPHQDPPRCPVTVAPSRRPGPVATAIGGYTPERWIEAVALELLHVERVFQADSHERLRRESRIPGALSHPHAVCVPGARRIASYDRTMKALLLIDHGSRRAASNELLLEIAEQLRSRTDALVVPAHMELADPTIEQGFEACVAAGATEVVAVPYFLSPGRHANEDVPRMVSEAAAKYPDVSYRVAPPLGPDELLLQLVLKRFGGSSGEDDDVA